MTGMDSDHCQIVKDCLSGEREVDEQALASLATLTERLERLRKVDMFFGSVAFSPAVEKLSRCKTAVAV